MYKILSLLMGSLTALMILLNGALAGMIGNYHASVYIHLTGLTLVSVLYWKEKRVDRRGELAKGCEESLNHPGELAKQNQTSVNQKAKKIPPILWTGGAIGFFTVIFTNLGFSTLGVSLTLALSLLGQTASSACIDHFGLFGTKRLPIGGKRLGSLVFIFSGIVLMTVL